MLGWLRGRVENEEMDVKDAGLVDDTYIIYFFVASYKKNK